LTGPHAWCATDVLGYIPWPVIIDAAFRHVALLGGILANETDVVFAEWFKR
jgi:hypothetical protein